MNRGDDEMERGPGAEGTSDTLVPTAAMSESRRKGGGNGDGDGDGNDADEEAVQVHRAGSPPSTIADDFRELEPTTSYLAIAGGILACPCTFLCSWFTLNPREEAVVLHCGNYTGQFSTPGVHFSNCVGREVRSVSTAKISYDTPNTKIVDSKGNPLLVSAIIVYRIVNPMAALLNVTNPHSFVKDQALAALKRIVSQYSYNELKVETEEVSDRIVAFLAPLIKVAGAQIYSCTLNELNYAPEIASSMLRVQAASATVEARQLIVKGAVDIAREAVRSLEDNGLSMSNEERTRLVSNLLVIITGDRDATPTMNVGTS